MKVHIALADINICSQVIPITCKRTDFTVDVSAIKANELPLAVKGTEPPCILFKCSAVGKLKTHQGSLMKRQGMEREARVLRGCKFGKSYIKSSYF
jgi:hypothetical protein